VSLVQNDDLIAMAPGHRAVNDASTIISQLRVVINDQASPPSVAKPVVQSAVIGTELQVGVSASKVEVPPRNLVKDLS
jgi:hypothetical protein